MFFIITFKLLTTKHILQSSLLLGGGLWLVEGGNWKMDATLNDQANRSFFASPQRICFNFIEGNKYEVNSTYKQDHYYEVVVLDIPMDVIKIIYDCIPSSQF